jgi:ribosomal-protein-alanine N-acetyltransferase
MLHLDDPHVDSLLALKGNDAVGAVSVLAVGEIGCIETLFISAPFRGQGVGRALMNRAMEICDRSLFKHVFLSMDPKNPAAAALYRRFGFVKIGEHVAYHPPRP